MTSGRQHSTLLHKVSSVLCGVGFLISSPQVDYAASSPGLISKSLALEVSKEEKEVTKSLRDFYEGKAYEYALTRRNEVKYDLEAMKRQALAQTLREDDLSRSTSRLQSELNFLRRKRITPEARNVIREKEAALKSVRRSIP